MDISNHRVDPHWTFVPEYRHLPLFAGIVVLAGLYVSSFVHYLLFHTLAEFFPIVIAFCIFFLAWNVRTYLANNFLRLLGFGYAFIALIDLVHTLSYKGMNIFPGYDSNLPTQLWIAARYMQAITLATASLSIAGRRLNDYFIIGCFTVTVSALLAAVFLSIFPDCYIEGKGLTSFKIVSEYVITIILLASLYFLFIKRDRFNRRVLLLIISSIVCTIFSEISFTAYVSVYGFANLLGHLFKLIAFYLIYRAILVTGLKEPFNLIFRELNQARDKLLKSNEELEQRVEDRTSELLCLNRELGANKKKFRELIHKINIAVVVHGPDTRVLMSNLMAQQLLGFTEKQMAGKSATDPDWHFLREDGSVLPVAEYPISFVLSARTPLSEYVTGIRCPDRNNIIWVLVNAEPEYNEAGEITQVIVSFVDITRRKHAEEALKKSEEKYRAVADFTYDWETWTDPVGKYIYISPSCKQISGYSADEFISDNSLFIKIIHPDDRAMVEMHLNKISSGNISEDQMDFRIIARNGEERWIEHNCQAVVNNEGKYIGQRAGNRDVTKRRESEAKYRALVENSLICVYIIQDNIFRYVNKRFCEVYGYTYDEVVDKMSPLDVTPEENIDLVKENIRKRLSGEVDSSRYTAKAIRKDGQIIIMEIFGSSLIYNGRQAILGTSIDITERKQAEETLRYRTTFLEALLNSSIDGILVVDSNGKKILQNQRTIDLWKIPQHIAKNIDDTLQVNHVMRLTKNPEQFAEKVTYLYNHQTETSRDEIELKDGTILDRYSAPVIGNDGQNYGRIWMFHDFTKRKQAEIELRRSEEYKTIMNRIDNVFLTIPDETMYREVLVIVLEVMKSKFGIFGYIGENGELIIPSMTKDIWDNCRIEDKSMVFPADTWGNSLWGKAIREKRTFNSDGPFHIPEGHIPVEHFLTVPIIYNTDTIGLISVANKENGYSPENINLLERIIQNISPILNARLQRDIHERRRIAAEESLKESEEKYRQLIINANEAIFIVQDEIIKFSNPKTMSMTGYSAEELADMRFLDLINPEDRDLNIEKYEKILEPEQVHEINVFRIINKKEKETWGQLITAPVTWEKKPGVICFLRDITEEKKLEKEFIQAQKMESIGRLAGGVAHDFNNMLNVIIGYADLALMDMDESSPISDTLKEISKAAKNSSNLTQQLLAFARKQTIAPEVLHLNDIIEDMLKILRRMIGENIEIAWLPGPDIWPVKMDTSQVNQILANLCVNARDAVGDKGKITISTANAVFDKSFCGDYPEFSQGEYVVVRIIDNGCGMDQETIGKIFDPFFTTKEFGKGTGLGLATVYGIVEQNNGFITVFSELKHGTSFNIHIPRYLTKNKEIKSDKSEKKITGGHETILLVEDDTSLLKIANSMLERLGYRVFSTSDAADAVKIAVDPASKINLLITDLIMPQMNGLQLAKKIISQNPDLKCMFMSGYIDNITDSEGILNVDKNFLQKPFSRRSLAAKVREVIDD